MLNYSMDFEPADAFISFSKLELYIEKYPEDAEKWLEFLKEPAVKTPRPVNRDELDTTLLESQKAVVNVVESSLINNCNDGCLFCRKSWIATDNVPKVTLICGHTFHTICCMYHYYNDGYASCIVENCNIDTWLYVRNIFRDNINRIKKAENILLKTYTHRNDFKKDILILKKNIYEFSKCFNARTLLFKNAKNDLIHKHIHALRYFQGDMNETVKLIKSSEEEMNFKLSIRKFRKHASHIFRKYHASFRDLYLSRVIKTPSWNVRSVLERHRNIHPGFYKLGCRIYPGKKIIKDFLEQAQAQAEPQAQPQPQPQAQTEIY